MSSSTFWILMPIFLCHDILTADIEYINSTLLNHFSNNRNHVRNRDYKELALKFIFDEFNRFGLNTTCQNFTWNTYEGRFANIIGFIKGDRFGKADDKIVALGAHYDTVENTTGVDDNGAGVAAMLEVIRQISPIDHPNIKRSNTVIFVSFDLEEYGLIGSKSFIQEWLNPWLKINYGTAARQLQPHGIIILDTIMEFNRSSHSQIIPESIQQVFKTFFPTAFASLAKDDFSGDFIATIYRNASDNNLATTFHKAWSILDKAEYQIQLLGLPFDNNSNGLFLQTYRDFFRSDHYNFWIDNIPSIFLTDTANFRGDMISCYHNPCDNIDVMLTEENVIFVGKIADAIANTMSTLAEYTDKVTSGAKYSKYCNVEQLVVLIVISLFLY